MKRAAVPFMETLKNFQPLKEYFARYRWGLAVGLVSLLAVDFLQLLIPLVIRKAIDELAAGSATSDSLLKLGGIILAIALVMAILRYVWRHLLFGISRKIEEGIRNRLYSHLQTLSLSFYHKTRTGDLMARAVNDINSIRMATGMGLVALTDGLVLGMAAIGFMVYIDLQLTLISILPAPILIYFTRILTRRMSSGYERVQAALFGPYRKRQGVLFRHPGRQGLHERGMDLRQNEGGRGKVHFRKHEPRQKHCAFLPHDDHFHEPWSCHRDFSWRSINHHRTNYYRRLCCIHQLSGPSLRGR
jgi:ABC-type multidrug transport system fused ATPase/permease subunit